MGIDHLHRLNIKGQIVLNEGHLAIDVNVRNFLNQTLEILAI